jgi:O-antigen ligase/tetratricopeptide (TPR) repeat protein
MQKTQNILTYLIIGGLFIIPFIVFLVPTSMFFPFIAGKGFAFRILVEILCGLFVVLACIDPAYRPKFSWITKAVLLFGGIVLLADLLGENVYKSLWSNYERMEGFVLIAHLVGYYLVASTVLNTKDRWKHFFNVSIFSSLLLSLYGFLQIFGKVAINQGGVRVDGTLGNASYFAIYLVLHIFLCLYLLFHETKKSWMKWTYGIVAVLEVIVLYFTATRGAILGFIGGLFLAGIIVLFKEKENKTFRKFGYWTIGGVVAVCVIFFAIRGTDFVKNSQVLSRFSTLSFSEIKTQGRYFVWPIALRGVAERPILGWGQENFNFVFNKYYDPGLYAQEQWFDRTHNVFLDWLIAGGILGFLAYASMYVAMFYYIWRKKSSLKLSEKSIFTGMIVAYIFHNIFVFDNLTSYIVFFSLLAYVHFVGMEEETPAHVVSPKTFSPETVNFLITPAVVVVTALVIYFVNIPALFANTTLIQAMSPQKEGIEKNLALFNKVYAYKSFGSGEATEQLIQIAAQVYGSQVPDVTKQKFYDLATAQIQEKVAEKPNDARYLVFAGSFFNRFGNYDTAIQYLNRAVIESPQKQTILFELGSSYINKGDYAKALEIFKKAYDLEPQSSEATMLYAIAGIYTKNSEVVKNMFAKLTQDSVVNDNRFLQAYAATGDYSTVISILNLRLQKDPTNAQLKLSLASAYATIGQKQKAIDIIREIIKSEPTFKDQGEAYIKQIQSQ